MERIFKRLICFSLTVILIFSSSSIVQAKTKSEIKRSNIDKIVDDVAEYLTERTIFGSGAKEDWKLDPKERVTPELKFDLYTKTQMACKISKTYEEGKIKRNLYNDDNELTELTFSSLKKEEIQKNAKNLFGSSKIKIEPLKVGRYGYRDGNQDAFEDKIVDKGKILVTNFGGWFRYPDEADTPVVVKVKKISGKSTKTVVIDCGINGYTDGNDLTKRKFFKWGTYTLTLKPADNKYGCIITNIEENWMQPDNNFQG